MRGGRGIGHRLSWHLTGGALICLQGAHPDKRDTTMKLCCWYWCIWKKYYYYAQIWVLEQKKNKINGLFVLPFRREKSRIMEAICCCKHFKIASCRILFFVLGLMSPSCFWDLECPSPCPCWPTGRWSCCSSRSPPSAGLCYPGTQKIRINTIL